MGKTKKKTKKRNENGEKKKASRVNTLFHDSRSFTINTLLSHPDPHPHFMLRCGVATQTHITLKHRIQYIPDVKNYIPNILLSILNKYVEYMLRFSIIWREILNFMIVKGICITLNISSSSNVLRFLHISPSYQHTRIRNIRK